MPNVKFTKPKRSRNELYLPPLRYIVADQWMDKLGIKAFGAWLKFLTWVDRRDEERDFDRIPYKLYGTKDNKSVAEKLGVSKATLYNTILKPLWEHHLIDLVEYEESNKDGQKPINIIVYECPRNENKREIAPLEKLRNWKDRESVSQVFGRKGGRPRKEDPQQVSEQQLHNPTAEQEDGLKNNTVDGLKNNTETVLKNKPNNVSNNVFNVSNNFSNSSNHHHEKITDNKQTSSVEQKEKHDDDLNYNNFRQFFTSQKGEDIKRHDIHYPIFQQLENSVGYLKMIELASKYIASGKHNTPQIAWFLNSGWQNYIDQEKTATPRKKQSKEKVPASLAQQQLQQAQQEVAATTDEVNNDEEWEAINNQLAQWQEQKKSKASQ